MQKNTLLKKGLAEGIIVLLIGISIQPAFANEISINAISNNKEDCNCEVVNKSDLNRIEKLLNRLEFIIKIISIRFRDNPEIKEKCQEILDLRCDCENINSWEFPILCTFLYPLWFLLVYLAEVGGTIIFLIVSPIFFSVNYLAYTLDCYWLTPI